MRVGDAWWPAAMFALAAVASTRSGLDLALADRIADGSAGFALRHAHWAQALHDAGDWLVRGAAACLLFVAARGRPLPRRTALYLLLAVGVTVGIVGLLKQHTAPVCPWSLVRYGGSIAQASGVPTHAGHCFPGGHSAGAFGWFALAFAFPRRRNRVIAAVLVAGFAFAALQWLRGAHFVSHDLWSAAIAWAVAVSLSPILGRRAPAPSASAEMPDGACAAAIRPVLDR
jgi:membrane-associated PAP2 superfamily phosphatase